MCWVNTPMVKSTTTALTGKPTGLLKKIKYPYLVEVFLFGHFIFFNSLWGKRSL